jgi:hypothetical protein
MRYLVDNLFPEAKRIRLVVNNLNTYSPAAFYYESPSLEKCPPRTWGVMGS